METQIENNYPAIVKQIHHEFEVAGEQLLVESLKILSNITTDDFEKAKELWQYGFKSNPYAKEYIKVSSEIKLSSEIAKIILFYQQKYPLYKFIREDDVIKICDKYNLQWVGIEKFKGFVPTKNLNYIKQFTDKFPQDARRIEIKSISVEFPWFFSSKYWKIYKLLNRYNNQIIFHNDVSYGVALSRIVDDYSFVKSVQTEELSPLTICAPEKDIVKKTIKDRLINFLGMRFRFMTPKIFVPDPVVLYPVKDGYLIVTAWGDEASDPIVVNPINN